MKTNKKHFILAVAALLFTLPFSQVLAQATNQLSIESEDGQRTNGARLVSDSSASGGSAVMYASEDEPAYDNDNWVFIGDSITVMSIWPPNLRNLVLAGDPDRNPVINNQAIGGTGAGSWIDSNLGNGDIDTILAASDAEFIPLALGTNDYHVTFEQSYEALVQRVIAAGRTPVLPYIPWTNGWPEGHAENWINPAIERILARNPEALRGPDLFAITVNRPDLFRAPGDVHPNETGQAVIQQAWANMMLTVDIQ